MSDNHDLLNDNDMYSFSGYEADDMCFNNDIATCGDRVPAVPKTAVNQRFLQFWKKNRCVFQFPQSGYEGIDLPQGIGFEE